MSAERIQQLMRCTMCGQPTAEVSTCAGCGIFNGLCADTSSVGSCETVLPVYEPAQRSRECVPSKPNYQEVSAAVSKAIATMCGISRQRATRWCSALHAQLRAASDSIPDSALHDATLDRVIGAMVLMVCESAANKSSCASVLPLIPARMYKGGLSLAIIDHLMLSLDPLTVPGQRIKHALRLMNLVAKHIKSVPFWKLCQAHLAQAVAVQFKSYQPTLRSVCLDALALRLVQPACTALAVGSSIWGSMFNICSAECRRHRALCEQSVGLQMLDLLTGLHNQSHAVLISQTAVFSRLRLRMCPEASSVVEQLCVLPIKLLARNLQQVDARCRAAV